jgi:hypothetical protein
MASTKSRSDEFQAGRGKRKPQSADARSPLKQFFGGPMNTLQNGVYYEKYPHVAPTYNDDDDYAESSYDGEPHFSPGPAQAEQGYDPRPRYETASVGGSRTRRSFVRESLRFILCGLVIAGISAAAFASQYGDPETVRMLKAMRKTLSADLWYTVVSLNDFTFKASAGASYRARSVHSRRNAAPADHRRGQRSAPT